MDGENIPWNDPDFSCRMLGEHLSQAHNAASRRFDLIDAQVDWIHRELLGGKPSRVLDLGCGPGLYLQRLARLRHRVTGIDFSPASVAYARTLAEQEGLDVAVVEGDLRQADFGGPFELVMLLSGELNVFPPVDARDIVKRAGKALARRGSLLIELSTYAAIKAKARGIGWHWFNGGLWSDEPHGVIEESVWEADSEATVVRYYVVVLDSTVRLYSASYQAYSDESQRRLLENGDLSFVRDVPEWPAMAGGDDSTALVATR